MLKPKSAGKALSSDRGDAAALAGVPRSTLYHWARTDLLVPSVSAEREKLRSYRDLLTLRLVRGLRTAKPDLGVARTALGEVRQLLAQVGDDLWQVDAARWDRRRSKCGLVD